MCRYFILLVGGLIFVSTLSSCAQPKPVTIGGVGIAQHSVFVEDMGNGMCYQHPAGLMWQIKGSEKISTWKEAEKYAGKLEFGGFADWRLPTRDECLMLSELLLMGKGDCPIKSKKAHWVSDKNKPGFWDDDLLCGGPDFRWAKNKEGFVRVVRP